MGQGHSQQFPLPVGLLLIRNVGSGEGDATHPGGVVRPVVSTEVSTEVSVEHTALARAAGLGLPLGRGDDLVQSADHRAPRGQAVKGAGPGQAFQCAAVQAGNTGPAAEIIDGPVRPVFFAFFHDGTDRALSHRFDGGQPNPETRAAGSLFPFGAGAVVSRVVVARVVVARVVVDGEKLLRPVDVRQQDGYPQPETLVHRAQCFLRIVQPGVEHRGHVFHRVMVLEIGRPVGDAGVADAMRLVERVTGEGFDQVEYLDGHLLVVALRLGAGDEIHPLFSHQGGDLLAHRLAHDVGGSQRVTGELLQDQQHLVLVNDDAVGLVQQFLEAGVGVGDGLAAVFSIDESLDVLHGAGAVEGDHRRDVAQVGGLQFLDVPLHPRAFKLEQVGGVAR